MVLDRKKIAKRYAQSWFFIDLVATMPWELFAGSSGSSLGVLRLPRVLRIGRLLKKFDTKASANLFRIFKLLCGFFLINHWVACARAGAARPPVGLLIIRHSRRQLGHLRRFYFMP